MDMTFKVLEYRQAWELRDGRWFRHAVVRRADGELRRYLLPDGRFGQ